MKKNRRTIGLLALVLTLLLALAPAAGVRAAGTAAAAGTGTAQTAGLQVDFLDVGQGDAAVVRCGGQSMLIDGGKPEKSDFIYSWLRQQGLSYLDYIVATHADADHVGGLSGALNYAKVGTALCSVTSADTETFRDFTRYLAAQGRTITVPAAGTSFALGGATVQVLGPLSQGGTDNNTSLVLRVVYGQTSFLFTGDAEREEEQALLNSGEDLQSTVLKVGHHGSDSSTSYLFLRTVNPQYAVISVGADNSYGHPTEAVLSRLRDAGVVTYRTDLQGTITAMSDGTNLVFSVQKNPDADTLSGAGAGQKAAGQSKAQSTGSGNTAKAAVSAASQNSGQTQTYVLNTNTKKFHYPSCSSAGQIKDKNKAVETTDRQSLIDRGYTPCKRCNP